jgi:hypothetical protein
MGGSAVAGRSAVLVDGVPGDGRAGRGPLGRRILRDYERAHGDYRLDAIGLLERTTDTRPGGGQQFGHSHRDGPVSRLGLSKFPVTFARLCRPRSACSGKAPASALSLLGCARELGQVESAGASSTGIK